ncbi:MAG: DNA-methyltransferase [Desulfotomaculales bacterium]
MSFHRFIVGHVLDALRSLPNESVHCIVTSPPYWGLRDYGLPPASWPEIEYAPMPGLPSVRVPAWAGQLGLEPSPEMYVAHLILVFREVRRVLRKDGTLWLVIGDSYAGLWGNYHPYSPPGKHGQRLKETTRWNRRAYDEHEDFLPPTAQPSGGLKKKDLVGVPWRVAFALQAEGWWLRSDIIWGKVNPIPESVKDRPTKAHEYIFLLAKSERYFYDAEAIREPHKEESLKRYEYGLKSVYADTKSYGGKKSNNVCKSERMGDFINYSGRNKRSVWTIITEPFPEAHFATFPTALVKPCIKAGTSKYGCCPKCRAPWERVVESSATRYNENEALRQQKRYAGVISGGTRHVTLGVTDFVTRTTVGWQPSCSCGIVEETIPCVVLDPFGGSGTTTLAAMELGRDSIYIDLKREYAEMALNRCGFVGTLLDCHSFEVVEIPAAEMPA